MSISLLPQELREKEAEEKQKAKEAQSLPDFSFHLPEKAVATESLSSVQKTENIGVRIGAEMDSAIPQGEFRIVKKSLPPPIVQAPVAVHAKTEQEIRQDMQIKPFILRIMSLVVLLAIGGVLLYGGNYFINKYQERLKSQLNILSQAINQTNIAINSYDLMLPLSIGGGVADVDSLSSDIAGLQALKMEGIEIIAISKSEDGTFEMLVSASDIKAIEDQTVAIDQSINYISKDKSKIKPKVGDDKKQILYSISIARK